VEQHIRALRQLVAAGWIGTPIGNPGDPAAVIYVRRQNAVVDALCIRSYDDAVATRETCGEVTRTTEGTVRDVIDGVLAW